MLCACHSCLCVLGCLGVPSEGCSSPRFPNCRFWLKINGGTREAVKTSARIEVGLEAPEAFFVELAMYEAEHCQAAASDIVWEDVNGTLAQGVPDS